MGSSTSGIAANVSVFCQRDCSGIPVDLLCPQPRPGRLPRAGRAGADDITKIDNMIIRILLITIIMIIIIRRIMIIIIIIIY